MAWKKGGILMNGFGFLLTQTPKGHLKKTPPPPPVSEDEMKVHLRPSCCWGPREGIELALGPKGSVSSFRWLDPCGHHHGNPTVQGWIYIRVPHFVLIMILSL